MLNTQQAYVLNMLSAHGAQVIADPGSNLPKDNDAIGAIIGYVEGSRIYIMGVFPYDVVHELKSKGLICTDKGTITETGKLALSRHRKTNGANCP